MAATSVAQMTSIHLGRKEATVKPIEWLYILKGNVPVPCNDPIKWAKWMTSVDRHVDYTTIKESIISTVFLGADISAWSTENRPVLFETRVLSGPLEGASRRYYTWEEAGQGHEDVCELVRKDYLERK